jgi:LytS/YehU family sensor histidine kinase
VQYGTAVFIAFILLFELHQFKSGILEKYIKWETQFYLRLTIEGMITTFITFVVCSSAYYSLYNFVWDMSIYFPSLVLYNTLGFFISLLFMVFVNVSFLLDNWKKAALKAEKLEKENIQAKLEALQNQISPHFLFNNFNILNALIDENIETAKRYLSKLSDVYRYILKHKHNEVVSLYEEITFVQDYAFLINTRFNEQFSLNIDVPRSFLNSKIPPVSLQPLVENAVKHNEISGRHTLTVNIKTEEQYLIISNNVKLKNIKSTETTHTGLANIRERYQHLSERQVEISKNEHQYVVKLPLLSIHNPN